MDDGDHYYDDVLWADPSIRTNYEAALGRLILAHNEVDLLVTKLIERCLERLGSPPAMERLKRGLLAERLRALSLLKALPLELALTYLDIEKLHQLNSERNVVAHGHFEQNPFNGDYVLISTKQHLSDYSAERLDKITEELRGSAGGLSALIAFYDPP